MAEIKAVTNEKVFQIKQFYGMNECPDGDTKLKMGEAAVMRNFCVTRDGNLRKRAGTKTLLTLSEGNPVVGLWHGMVNKKNTLLAACNGKLYSLWNDTTGEFDLTELGNVDTSTRVSMFGFSEIVYIMDGVKYRQYDGTTYKEVEGYIPLVTISVPPEGGGETLEGVNKLIGKRRSWFSPDGTATAFILPEENISGVDTIVNTVTGATIPSASYTVDATAGKVTFSSAPERGTNSIEITWSVSTSFRSQVEHMRFSELYNGTVDTRVFLYGDGSNKAFYSGLDYDGQPRADYFPDLNEIAVGDANTPITGLIRHYSRMIAFKSNSAWTVQFGTVTLADAIVTAAFYVTPINRSIGCSTLGQAQLVLNSPVAMFGKDLYEWKSSAYYNSNLTADERQARRISDRIHSTLETFDPSRCICFDDNPNQEYYICFEDKMLVHNYVCDAWYEYTGIRATSMVSFFGETYIGSSDGKFKHLSSAYISDDGAAIDAYWESGSMSFGQDYMRKYSAQLWVGMKPQASGEITVTVQTDKKSNYAEKIISTDLTSFARLNFAAVSFRTNRKPQMSRLKIKAKKFVFYKLVFENDSPSTTAIIVSADIRVRFTGMAK